MRAVGNFWVIYLPFFYINLNEQWFLCRQTVFLSLFCFFPLHWIDLLKYGSDLITAKRTLKMQCKHHSCFLWFTAAFDLDHVQSYSIEKILQGYIEPRCIWSIVRLNVSLSQRSAVSMLIADGGEALVRALAALHLPALAQGWYARP